MDQDSTQGRRTPQETAAAIREYASQYDEGTARRNFLETLATAIASRRTGHGVAEGHYWILPSPNGMVVQCENAAQTGWIEALCYEVKINFFTPINRAHERELQIAY